MKHLRKFETEAEKNVKMKGYKYDTLYYNVQDDGCGSYSSNYDVPFYVENLTKEQAQITISSTNVTEAPELTFSFDLETWHNNKTEGYSTIPVPAKGKTYIRCVLSNWGASANADCLTMKVNKLHAIGGNILSLLYGDTLLKGENKFRENINYIFRRAFISSTTLKDASKLSLPINLTIGCYSQMFASSTKLKYPPVLPAPVAAPQCYMQMFQGCSSLCDAPDLPSLSAPQQCYAAMFQSTAITRAPKLPATLLGAQCYLQMFAYCSSLKECPELPATTLAENCYRHLFAFCTRITTAPALPATTLASSCYTSIFQGCTSLVNAPVLPATAMEYQCYVAMFQDCTALVTAPALPATTLNEYCYQQMFQGCTSLMNAPALPASTLFKQCYTYMFKDCTSLVNAPALPATTLAESCYQNMFQNCKSLIAAPNLPAVELPTKCYTTMFGYCDSLTTPPASIGSSSTTSVGSYSCYGMFQNCPSLLTAPAMPAPVLESYAYQQMFAFCTSLTSAVLSATTLATSCYRWLFEECNNMTSCEVQTLNNSQYTFKGTGNCSTLIVHDTVPPTIDTDATKGTLVGLKADCTIYVPAESVEAYKAATGWSSRAAYIQAIPSN